MKKLVESKLFWLVAFLLLIFMVLLLCFMNKEFKDTYLFLNDVKIEEHINIMIRI